MGNCKTKPNINTYTSDVDYQVDGYLSLKAVKFGTNYANGTSTEYKNSGSVETVMHVFSGPKQLRKSRNNEKDLQAEVEPVSTDELPLYAKSLASSTNNVSERSTSSPLFHILENGLSSPSGNFGSTDDISKQLEAIQEKYHSTKLDRDKLVKKNYILSKDLQKAESLNAVRIKENEQLVQKSQTESVRWKELATAVQTANAELVQSMETMSEQLDFLAPQNFALVKQQRNGLVEEIAHCEKTIKNEVEQRRILEKARKELDAKLKQEKASVLATSKAREAEMSAISKKLELENLSLEKQIKDFTLELEDTQRQADILEKEGKLLKWMLEQNDMEVDEPPTHQEGELLKSNDEATLVLSKTIEQVGKQRNYFNQLYEIYNSIVTDKDKTFEETEMLKIRLGIELENEDTVRVDDFQSMSSPTEDEMSDTERIKKHWIRRGSSFQNLTAKIGVLQMESRHKSKMIQVLEQEGDEYGGHDNRWGNRNRSLDKWEYNRYQMYGHNVVENERSASCDSADLGDDEAESVIHRSGNYGTENGGTGNESSERRSL